MSKKTQLSDKICQRSIFFHKLLFIGIALLLIGFASIIISHYVFGLTSGNAFLYFIKGNDGKIHISNEIGFEETERLIFMIDASCIFKMFEGILSASIKRPLLELTWNKEKGNGVIKEYRPDGTRFLVVLSRYKEAEGVPRGIFFGGDLPYGDVERWLDRSRNNTGIAFYDGNEWRHIWCSINEALSIKGMDEISIEPWRWRYTDSKILKSTLKEIIIESNHELNIVKDMNHIHLTMKRILSKRASEDYVLLKVILTNAGNTPVDYSYSFGDEPWVGEFGTSIGDVGWTSGKVFKFENYISPIRYNFAGMWDYGNDMAGEPHRFSNYANFIEWLDTRPTVVYFSNDFTRVDEKRPLSSFDNRILNLLWLYQTLLPGESRVYTLALGMARPEPLTGFPLKPEVILSEGGS